MKLNSITLSIILSSSMLFTPVIADDLNDLKKQLQLMQQQMQLMQAKIEAQEERLTQQHNTAQKIVEAESSTINNKSIAHELVDSVSINGEIAVNARATDSLEYNNENASDIVLDTLAIGFDAQITSWVNGHIYFLYNQDPGPGSVADELHVDEGTITIGNAKETPFYLSAGRMYLPFGNYESHMVSDPITLTLGETREEAVQLGMEMDNGFYGSAYLFNGRIRKQKNNYSSSENSQLDNFGLNMGYAMENDDFSLDIGAGYSNNLATSDGLQDSIFDNAACSGNDCINDYIAGLSLHAITTIGPINLIGEYITALDSFQAGEITGVNNKKLKPRAWNIEAAYNYAIFGKESSIALGYQGSDDFYLDSSSPDFYSKAWLLGMNIEVYKNTTLSFEWRHAQADSEVKDVIKLNGGSYSDEDRLQLKMSVVF